MSAHLGMHRIKSVEVEALGAGHTCLTMKIVDDSGMVVTLFLEPDQLDIFTDAVAAYRSPMEKAA